MHPTPPTLVFDLDGTLVDSAPDLVDALNAILVRDGIAPLSYAAGRPLVGRGGRALIRRGLEAGGHEVSDSRLEEMFAAFLAHYEVHLADKTRFFPGVEAALDRFIGLGHKLAVLTNKFERPAKKLVAALGSAERFVAIVGQDTFAVSKPNGATLRLTIEKAGGDTARAIMIGDTATDVSTARNAALPVVAVDFGYADGPAEALGADRLIGHFDELADAVAALSERFEETSRRPSSVAARR